MAGQIRKHDYTALRRACMEILRARDATTAEIAKALNVSPSMAYMMLEHLRDVDRVIVLVGKNTRDCRWSTCREGRALPVSVFQTPEDLGDGLKLLMGINPYPHHPGKPVEVKSKSSGGITYKPPQSYGVADYGAFA